MNYIELLNLFYERIQCSRVSNNGQLLYYTLLAINNKSSWSDWFSRTNVNISSMMGISEKAFINARAELKQLGLIDFIPSKRRGECTKYRILNPTKYSTKCSTNGSTKEVQTTVQSTDINKLKQKQKSMSNDIPEKYAPAERYPAGCFALRCVDQLIASITEQLPSARVPMTAAAREKWADEIDRMLRLDKRSEAEIREALDYAVTDPFWRSNIRSTAKLREKFETLLLQSRRKSQKQPSGQKPANRFHNLEEHGYDYEKMVWELMNRDGGERNGGNGEKDPTGTAGG